MKAGVTGLIKEIRRNRFGTAMENTEITILLMYETKPRIIKKIRELCRVGKKATITFSEVEE